MLVGASMKVLTSAVIATALLAGTANAADLFGQDSMSHMPDKRPAEMWTGPYLGLTLGYGWADLEATSAHATVTGLGSGSLPLTGYTSSKDSFNGGITLGYNWYLSSNVVTGIEADASYGDYKYSSGTLTANNVLSAGDSLSGNVSAGFNWFGTLRGRLGYLVAPRTLIYGTGGLAWANAKASANYTYTGGGSGPLSGGVSDNHLEWGWTLGLGVEDKINQNVSMKLEYLYLDYSNAGFNFSQPGVSVGFDGKASMNLIRTGINYQF
jgi:outer membrane immunogenic protein